MTTHDMRSAFMAKQRQLLAALEVVPRFTGHGTTIGDDSEANWTRVLREFLPARYGVAKGHVMDSEGNESEQIDLLIYDPQYTPLLTQTANGDLFVPAEAVYAVFEVKQEATKRFMDYAGKKIASVRSLHRTSVKIPHAGGVYEPKAPIHILGGLLTTRSGWGDDRKKSVSNAIKELGNDRRIDIGCALGGFAFNVPEGDPGNIEFSDRESALLFFLFKLFSRLQGLGTVAAVDVGAYVEHLGFGGGRPTDDEDEGGTEEP